MSGGTRALAQTQFVSNTAPPHANNVASYTPTPGAVMLPFNLTKNKRYSSWASFDSDVSSGDVYAVIDTRVFPAYIDGDAVIDQPVLIYAIDDVTETRLRAGASS